MYYDIMSSQITKLVLVPLEEWKRLNKNGVGGVGGDTYTTTEIPSSKPRNQEGRGKNQEEKEELNPPPPHPPPPISHHPALQDDEELGGAPLPPPPLLPLLPSSSKKGRRERGGEGARRRKGGIEIIRNVGNRPPGKRVSMKKRKNMYTSNTT